MTHQIMRVYWYVQHIMDSEWSAHAPVYDKQVISPIEHH